MNLDKYNQIRDTVRTGDVFAFSGKGNTSNLIKNFTHSKYSHVGMALWITPLHSLVNRLFIIESTTLNTLPDIDGSYRRGVQIIPMAQRLEGYVGQCWWLPIKQPLLDDDEKTKLTSWLFQREASHVDYDTTQAIKAAIDPEKWPRPFRWLHGLLSRWTDNKEDLKKMFCSELVTKALQVINRVPPEVISSEMLPSDVVLFPCLGDPVQL
jgi:hypothetical protein